jgi:acetyl esterase/lipase
MPAYRLAPEYPFPAAVDDAVASYRWLVDDQGIDPDHIAITGDSAGGGLGLALLLRLRDEGDRLPACYAGLSPWTDLAATGESIHLNNGRDALFGIIDPEVAPKLGLLYAEDHEIKDPLVSPLYADLTGLPPLLVHVGEAELIRDDGVRLVEEARAQGVDASVGIFRDMWHVFQAFPVPEASQSLREIGGFIRRHTGTTE